MRPTLAMDPRRFGRRRRVVRDEVAQAPVSTVRSDLRLFATTFVGGFLFVSVMLA